jgi:Na+-translocating ferredoxin:NAD+ oxidoreductase RnfD subunit
MAKPLRLAGTAMALLSLWMPWYAVHLGALASQIDARAGSLPAGFAELAKGLLAAVPQDVHVTGWQAMAGGDVAIAFLAGGLALLSFATADRIISVAGAVALVAVVGYHVAEPAGPSGLLTLNSGAWVALLGAGLTLASTFLDGEPQVLTPAPEPLPAWQEPARPASVAPPR